MGASWGMLPPASSAPCLASARAGAWCQRHVSGGRSMAGQRDHRHATIAWTLLSRALRCALAQLDVAVEVIVVDDGSTTPPPPDPVWTDPRVRMIRQATNQGYVAARNAGAEASKGEWLAWLDDDDLWAPSKLARQLAAARTGRCRTRIRRSCSRGRTSPSARTWPAPPVGRSR